MKAPKRERDLSTGQLRYRWSETGALEHFRHAHAFEARRARAREIGPADANPHDAYRLAV